MLPDTLFLPDQDGQSAEWQEPPVLSLNELGMIQGCSQSFERLFDYQCRELLSLHITKLFPQLWGVSLDQEGRFTPLFISLCHGGHIFQAHPRRGDPFSSQLSIARLAYEINPILRLFVHPLGEEVAQHVCEV